ncbi:MAG TPA: 7-carboxy-7-deazaguanine synthase QueE [Candidatus Ozemobacteraceae bacterium]|nr:7-carboxy-7-deazaguanine synthase QueE [Candidatus Ozemobacteraceae bacterium]
MSETAAELIEVFPSIQGEGMQVGLMQLFVRFAGCNLLCRNCDTQKSWEAGPGFVLSPWPGRRSQQIANPISANDLYDILVSEYPLGDFHSISLTGGEPLKQARFLKSFARICRNEGLKIFLETNGTLAAEGAELADLIDFWSVDLKLSKTWGLTARQTEKHRRFLAFVPPEHSYLKLVIDATDDPEEIIRLLEKIDTHRYIAVVQPFSSSASSLADWDSRLILEWLQMLRPHFREVRWIPQVHKLLRIP